MTPLDRINAYTAHRMGLMTKEERDARIAGDELSSLCESVQDAVNEVIRVCREHGRCERNFPDLRIEVYAYPHASGKGVAWGINSLVTGVNTRRGTAR